MLGLQKGYDILAKAPIGEGAPVRTILVEDESSVRDPLCGLSSP